MSHRPLRGAGLGFRRELIAPLKSQVPDEIAFFELAPENWAGMGGKSALRRLTLPCFAGSSLSWPNTG